MIWPRRNRTSVADERGAALVEFALLVPLLFAILMGIFTGGIAYNRKISMSNAVREGARFGATLDDSGTWATEVTDRTVAASTGDLSSGQVCVRLITVPASVRRTNGNSACGTEPATPTGVQSGDCIVKVWAQRGSNLQVIFFSKALTLNEEAVGRYERDCT